MKYDPDCKYYFAADQRKLFKALTHFNSHEKNTF